MRRKNSDHNRVGLTSVRADTTGLKIEDMVGGLPPVPCQSSLLAENERLRQALETIATGHAFGPVEVARVALGLPATPSGGFHG